MKNKTTAGLLALFFGWFGAHRFYLGKKNALVYLLLFWTSIPAIFGLFEGIKYLSMSDEKFNKLYNEKEQSKISIEDLERLHTLKEKGVISEEEFQEKKSEVFNNKKVKPENKIEGKIGSQTKRYLLIAIIGFFLITLLIAIFSDSEKSTTKIRPSSVVNNVGNVNIKPDWYGKSYIITTIATDGTEPYDIKTVNVWTSYQDRSKVLFKLKNNESVSLLGYDKENNYCQIEKDSQRGWISCGWIKNLPTNMSSYSL